MKYVTDLLKKTLLVDTFEKAVTLPANGQGGVDIPFSLPQGATILALALMQQPNANWIYCGLHPYDNTKVTIAYHNTAGVAISGTFKVAVFYTK